MSLIGATLSFEASSFADTKGKPPRTGQPFIALEPRAFRLRRSMWLSMLIFMRV